MMVYQPETVTLVLLLIAVFVLAFAVLKMILETLVVGSISALFYVSMTYITEMSFSTQGALTYTVLGVVLYIGYSLLSSILELTNETARGGKKIFGILSSFLNAAFSLASQQFEREGSLDLKQRIQELMEREKPEENKDEDNNEESTVKEVVLDDGN